jgi:polysaccharide pyruvyl transferase CsaB
MKKILIFGYFGEGNFGDDLIFDALKKIFSNNFIIGVFSKKNYYKDVINFERYNIKSIIEAINWSDIVIGGGGGVLQDKTSFKSLLYYIFIIWFSVLTGKRVYIIGQSFSTFKYKISRFLVSKTLKKCEKIYVRDRFSLSLLNYMGINNKKLKYIPDLVFLIDIPNISYEKKYLGINFRSWKNLKPKNLENILEFLKKEGDLLFFSFQDSTDLEFFNNFSKDIIKDIKIISTKDEEFWNYFLSCKYFIGMRLHSLILATISGIPFLGLSYDDKIDAFVYDLGWKYSLSISKLDNFESLWKQLKEEQGLENYLRFKSYELKEKLLNEIENLKNEL